MSIQNIQGAKLNIAKPGLKSIGFTPSLGLNDPDSANRRVNTADPHTELLEVAEFKADSRLVRTTLPHNERGSGRRNQVPR